MFVIIKLEKNDIPKHVWLMNKTVPYPSSIVNSGLFRFWQFLLLDKFVFKKLHNNYSIKSYYCICRDSINAKVHFVSIISSERMAKIN